MATSSRVTGFTLIELLISMTVLSMVIGIATFSFSLFSKHWDVKVGDFDLAAGQFQRVELAYRAVRDAAPWLVAGGSSRERIGFYFLGRPEGMTFVSESPVFNDRGLSVVRVFREREEDLPTWRLVYEEAPLSEVVLRNADQTLPFQHRLVILRGLPSLEFSFYGWKSLEARSAGADGGAIAPEWFAEYDGVNRQQQPMKVAMRMGSSDVFFDMAERDDVILGRAAAPE